ncbi:MAG: VWA domain-containing protein [Alphaproteobacteria bacterium]|nr:VWA domain-containing protein [Alphaproteobacteria bacterium]
MTRLGLSTLALLSLTACTMTDLRGDADQAVADDTGNSAEWDDTGSSAWDDSGPAGEDTGADIDDTGFYDSDDPEEQECDAVTPVQLFMSPDDSNSMSSPVQVRAAILDSWDDLPNVPIRTYEFLNYYTFDYPAADPGRLAVFAHMVPHETEPDQWKLQIAASSPPLTREERQPMNLILCLDTSGSMAGTSIALLKESVRVIAGQLKEGDVVSAVRWDTSDAVILDSHAVSGPDDPVLIELSEELSASGGTNLAGGLEAAYALAERNFGEDRVNRVVLISDGGANVGNTSEELIGRMAGTENQRGVYMVGVGTGSAATYNDRLMDRVTDLGRGASVFIDSAAEAQKILGDRFISTMDVAARDLRIEVGLPPGFEIVRSSAEEWSTNPREVDPQNIAPDDTVVLYQTVTTCEPALAGPDAQLTVTLRYEDAVTFEPRVETHTATFAELAESYRTQMIKAELLVAFADGLTAYQQGERAEAQALRQEALRLLDALRLVDPNDPDLAELEAVLAVGP